MVSFIVSVAFQSWADVNLNLMLTLRANSVSRMSPSALRERLFRPSPVLRRPLRCPGYALFPISALDILLTDQLAHQDGLHHLG
ncbi:MAG: hypothetical protein PHV74_06935, partial [Dehalococcoidia bacterium]|nr:hypothetical protein [Dehalococcoidia bacterium]